MTGGMLDKMTSRLERHAAHLTFMREASLVPLHVDFLVLFAGKGAIAYLAYKRFLPCVTSVMRGQRVLFLEGHGTSVTLVGVVLDVTIVMIFQLHLVAEGLVAV